MSILEETSSLLRKKLGHVFESLTVERIVTGLFFTGVKLSNNACGVCYTPIKDIPEAVCCPTSAATIFNPIDIKGKKASYLLESLSLGGPLKTAAAIATLNALSGCCWPDGSYDLKTNMDAFDAVKITKENSVAVIGAIVPVLKALKARGGTWWVVEQDPVTLKADEMKHYVPANESSEIIGKADVLVITGVTLINHTLEGILKAAGPDTEIAVMGPTASMIPDALFERGVRVVGGVWVKKPDELLDVLAAGGSGYHFLDTLADRIVIERK